MRRRPTATLRRQRRRSAGRRTGTGPGMPCRRPAGRRTLASGRRAPEARIAIVIDDWGYDWAAAEAFLQFPEKLTVAVIPFLPLSEEHAERARAAGHEGIVHLPMEPLNPTSSGPRRLHVAMDDEASPKRWARRWRRCPATSA